MEGFGLACARGALGPAGEKDHFQIALLKQDEASGRGEARIMDVRLGLACARGALGLAGEKDLVFLTRFRILSYSISSSVSPWACLPTFCRWVWYSRE